MSRITCTAGPFCLAVDNYGNTKTYRAGTWTRAAAIDLVPYEVSCTSPTFCVAADQDGDTYTYNGTTWTHRADPRVDLDNAEVGGVSCVSPTWCTIVADYYATPSKTVSDVFNGTAWAKAIKVGPGSDVDISCSSTSFRLTGGKNGVYEYNGTVWSRPIDVGFYVRATSCGSPTFCVALSETRASVFNGTTWSKPKAIAVKGGSLFDVSCPSDDFCLASDDALSVYTLS